MNAMFHEIYGSYFQAVSEILSKAVDETLTGKKLREIVREKAFTESSMLIPEALESGEWKLLDSDYSTPLANAPQRPLTLLEKRWMKAMLLDPRIKLFAPDASGLEDVKPLFTPEMFVYFDRYGNGDPFEDESYIAHFRTILAALQNGQWLKIEFHDRKGKERKFWCQPEKLEYSSKDDKFRLICLEPVNVINLARIDDCQVSGEKPKEAEENLAGREADVKAYLVFDVVDERSALDRVTLHFSHLEKETKRLGEKRYRVTIYYDRGDETEILIRILSFGPNVRVIEPESFIWKIRERLEKQFATFFP